MSQHDGWDDGYWYPPEIVPPVGAMVSFWHFKKLVTAEVLELPLRSDGHQRVVDESGKEWHCWPPGLTLLS